jgi:hypothetical protein
MACLWHHCNTTCASTDIVGALSHRDRRPSLVDGYYRSRRCHCDCWDLLDSYTWERGHTCILGDVPFPHPNVPLIFSDHMESSAVDPP